MSIPLLVYVLTTVAGLGVVWTAFSGRSRGGVSAAGPRRLHLIAGLLALIGWIAFLVTDSETFAQRELVGVVALFFWWLTVGAGLLLLVQYLPSSGGRHAVHRQGGRFGSRLGGWLVHLTMLVCAGVFTYAYMFSQV